MTSVSFISTVTACAVLTGNGYAEIQRDSTGRPVALYPRHPDQTRPVRLFNGDLAFECTDSGKRRVIANANMLHIPGVSLDGYGGGLSPIQAAKQTLGLHKAAELSSAWLFGNGSRPSGILTMPSGLDDKQRINARESWENSQSGENQGRTAVLPPGFAWQSIAINPDDMQFIATMNYTRSQVAGLFRLPPHMIGDTSRLSNSNHESQALEYVTFTLRPWLTRWETEVQRKLMPSIGRNAGRYSVRFDTAELIRGDFATQMTGFATGRQWGWYSANDVRTAIGLNPLGPQGDQYMIPLNMQDAALKPDPVSNDEQDVTPSDDIQDQIQNTTSDGDSEGTNRTLVSRMSQTYSAIFRDALGRVTAREKRDSESIGRCFSPVLQTIADEAIRQAQASFKLNDADLNTDKIIRDALKSLEKRAGDW
jgi:HK97 family phage portal protein